MKVYAVIEYDPETGEMLGISGIYRHERNACRKAEELTYRFEGCSDYIVKSYYLKDDN